MNKKGFTLIELLAVIIILGILMIIAIPSVTRYISDSRKAAYIDTAKQVASATKNLVNSGKLEMYDTNVAYYIPNTCIKVENGEKAKSPYGEFIDDRTYVVVTYDGKGYSYYWVSLDDTGTGVKEPISIDKLEEKDIETDLTRDDVKDDNGVGKEKVVIFSSTCDGKTEKDAYFPPVCKKATVLHTAICEKDNSEGCNAKYQTGATITYGSKVNGSVKVGDAFDCDVNSDGIYDPEEERFYYIGSDNQNSILIFYKNITDQMTYAYDMGSENWHGPRVAYQYLPDNSVWDNPGLLPQTERQLLNDGVPPTSNAYGNNKADIFSYTNKSSRLLTYQEYYNICNRKIGTGSMDNYNFLMEKLGIYEGNSGAYGYWLEGFAISYSNRSFATLGNFRGLNHISITYSTGIGIRPVITVKTSNIEQ